MSSIMVCHGKPLGAQVLPMFLLPFFVGPVHVGPTTAQCDRGAVLAMSMSTAVCRKLKPPQIPASPCAGHPYCNLIVLQMPTFASCSTKGILSGTSVPFFLPFPLPWPCFIVLQTQSAQYQGMHYTRKILGMENLTMFVNYLFFNVSASLYHFIKIIFIRIHLIDKRK